MKYKYRRLIIVGCIVMMFVGMLTMSIGSSNKNSTDDSYDEQINRAKTEELKKDEYPKINKLMENYLNAELDCDLDELSLYVNDIDSYSTKELKKKFKYVEHFENISCYTIEGYEADTYVVYLYREYKLENIDTLIPSVVLNYVCKNSSGEYVVYTGDVKKETNDFIKATQENPSVLDLVDMVNNNIERIKEEDEDVKLLLEQLDLVTTNVENGEYETRENGKSK